MTVRSLIGRRALARLEKNMPDLFRRIEIRVLADLASKSFGRPRPKGKGEGDRTGSGAEAALRQYAAFTKACMENCDTDPEELFRSARALGERVRRASGLTRREDLQRLVFLLYRGIGISMDGELPGEIRVKDCYFSRSYTPEQCALMSSVDSGIVSGICGGGRLCFTERITEGSECCRACLCGKEKGKEINNE